MARLRRARLLALISFTTLSLLSCSCPSGIAAPTLTAGSVQPGSTDQPSTQCPVPAKTTADLDRGKISHSVESRNGLAYHVARMEVKARPDKVWSVLTDYEHAPAIIPNLKNLKVLSRDKDSKKIWFSVASLGGLWRFQYVLNIQEFRPHRIEWHRASGAFKTNKGFWQLEPIDGGRRTLVTYAKHIDGGLLLPRVFVDEELKKTMPAVLSSLRTAVTRKQRQIAQAGNQDAGRPEPAKAQ